MIGNEVRAYLYDNKYVEGHVIEKYRGTKQMQHEVPSGHGGTFRVSNHFPCDYYIIETENEGLKHVECSNVIKLVTE